MTSSNLRKRIGVLWNRLYLYPAPDPLPWTRSFWVATGLVALAALLFSGFFIFYLTARHNTYLTNAEDLGIMDQAIWNTVHGHILQQTICNIGGDTNCYNFSGISRFAIHFEPILFPVSLFYLIWPTPQTLLVIQTLIVATGAFPAFWLARLRLRNEWAAAGIALLYLLYPAQQYATVNDFHAVTFTAAFLLFMLYFMYTRRTAWLFVFAILSMACKEEIPVVIALYGLWSMIFQRRWRSGLALALMGIAGTGLALLVAHLASPTGSSLLASRYTYLGKGTTPLVIAREILLHPVDVLKNHVLEHSHLFYIRQLLVPAGYLPLLAPWVLVLALPTLTLNLLSSDPNMYSGLYQYNAELVPVLIFATTESVVLLIWLFHWFVASIQLQRGEEVVSVGMNTSSATRLGIFRSWGQAGLLVVLLGFVLLNAVRADYAHGSLPFSQGFQWPRTNDHTQLAQRFVDMIPSEASVSAQSALVPHISHRQHIYLFPYADDRADYIFLDVTSDLYPLFNDTYNAEVRKVIFSGSYGIKAAQDGYVLLQRGLSPPGISPYSTTQSPGGALPDFPSGFCSFQRASPQEVEHPLQVIFTNINSSTPLLDLVGYSVIAPQTIDPGGGYAQVTVYWRVRAPVVPPLHVVVLTTVQNGAEHLNTADFSGFAWCPTNTWKPGVLLRITSAEFRLADLPPGLAHVSIALLPLTQPYSTIMDVQARLSLHIVSAPGNVSATSGTNALQLAAVRVTS